MLWKRGTQFWEHLMESFDLTLTWGVEVGKDYKELSGQGGRRGKGMRGRGISRVFSQCCHLYFPLAPLCLPADPVGCLCFQDLPLDWPSSSLLIRHSSSAVSGPKCRWIFTKNSMLLPKFHTLIKEPILNHTFTSFIHFFFIH